MQKTFQGNERYTVRRCLGGGNLGLVYEGYDRRRKVEVALKALRTFSSSGLYRLKQEFRSLADLSHPNLVTLYELVGDDEGWFISMELVKGVDWYRHARGEDAPNPLNSATWISKEVKDLGSDPANLIQILQPEGRLNDDLPRLHRSLVQLLSGVAALHEADKLHRDIKPSNVLVTSEGRVVVVDFGLVYDGDRAASELSGVDKVMGTVAYIAPDQLAGKPPSFASDMYSVGVMLFQGLTGRLPFGGTILEMLDSQQNESPPRPSDVVDGVPKTLDDLCFALLSREPEQRPSALASLLRLGEDPSMLAVQARVRGTVRERIEGREQERKYLEDAWNVASKGRVLVAGVHGETGMGKSALIYHFLRTLRSEHDVTILRGRCYEREQVPYKAFDSLMDGLRRRLKRLPSEEVEGLLPPDSWLLARIFPVLKELVTESEPTDREGGMWADPAELRLRAFHALRELIRNLARQRPLVVVIDDVQWGDADSAQLLTGWLHSLQRSRLLVVLVWRSEDADSSPFLMRLMNDPVWARTERRMLELGPLSQGMATAVARGLLGDRHPNPTEAAVWIAEQSSGNPHLLSELAATIRSSAELGGAESIQNLTLEELLQERVGQLPEEAERMLLSVAVAGRPLPVRVLARAAKVSDAERHKAVSLLRTQRFIRTHDGPLGVMIELYHSRVGKAVRDARPPEARARLHLALAHALEAEQWDDPEALMMHFLYAGQQERASELALAAARIATDTLAFDQAAKLYQTALELGVWEPEVERDLTALLADALTHAGRGQRAAHLLLEIAEQSDRATANNLRRKAVEQLLSNGYFDEGRDLLRGVLKTVGAPLPTSRAATLRGRYAHRTCLWFKGLQFVDTPENEVSADDLARIDACWFTGLTYSTVDPLLGAYYHDLSLLYALQAGEPYRVLRALTVELATMVASGDYDWKAWSRLLVRCKALANKLGRAHGTALVQLGEGMSAYLDGRFKNAHRLLRQAERLILEACPGVTWELATARLFALRSLMLAGDLKHVENLHGRTLGEAADLGNKLLTANLRTDLFTLLPLAADDPARARLNLAAARSDSDVRGTGFAVGFELRGAVLVALYEGHVDEAWSLIESAWPNVVESRLERTMMMQASLYDARGHAALAIGGKLALVKRLVRTLKRTEHRFAAPIANMLLGGVSVEEGNMAAAEKQWEEAMNAFNKAEMKLYHAVVQRRLGQLRGGRTGAQLVATADGWLENQGVVDISAFCRAMMPVRALG